MRIGGVLHRNGGGGAHSWHRRQRAIRDGKVNRFADLLATGLTIGEAARVMEIDPSLGRAYLGDMRKALGWQAC